MTDQRTRRLEIGGDTVVFDIEVSNNVASGHIPSPQSFLGYRVIRDGRVLREGVLTRDVHYPGTVSEQFTDEQLLALYRSTVRTR